MRRLWIIILFLFLATQVKAQETDFIIYLPVIVKGQGCNGMNILEVSDGTTTVNLLSANFGFCLNSWNPAIAQPKRGGVFQSSSLSQGRKLVDRKFENVQDSFNFDIKGSGQPETILYIAKLIQLLEQATEYWTGHADKVWLKAKADCEDAPRYALIVDYSWPELKFPYGSTFFQATEIASMINVDLGIEHELWSSSIPGESACAEASAVQSWTYVNLWADSDGGSTVAQDRSESIIKLANNDILNAQDEVIRQSQDNGDTWASVQGPTARFIDLFQTSTGAVLAFRVDGLVARSTSNGDVGTWAFSASGPAGGGYATEAANGHIFAVSVTNGNIWRSTDDGITWASFINPGLIRGRDMTTLSNNTMLASGVIGENVSGIYQSQDDGVSWTIVQTFSSSAAIYVLLQLDNGKIVATFGGNIYLAPSVSDLSFSFINSVSGTINDIAETDAGIFIAADSFASGAIVSRTVDEFVTITTEEVIASIAGNMQSVAEGSSGRIFAGGTNQTAVPDESILSMRIDDTANMGRSATCTNEVYVANKQNIANLTHIKIDDGGVFTDIFPIAAFPQDLLPAIPVVNDAVYFGSDTSVFDTGPFDGLVYDIETVVSVTSGGSFTLVYEYWNGAWVTLTTRDNTETFGILGVNSVHWEQPSDWVTTTIDGITAYWVRVRLSALAGTLTPPTQQNRDIYTIVLPYANIASSEILGDIPALLQEKLQNQSDEDGRGGSAPDLWDNRIISGLRSVSRGTNYQAYLNVSDEQNPIGITITDTGANTAFAADVTTPTGRRATYTPVAAPEAMATQVTIALGPSIARDFYGKYHALLRVQRTAGAITDFDVQLQFISGSGGIQFTTASKQIQTTTAFELLDFGQVQLPVGGTFKSTDLGDITEIRIQASAESNNPVNFYDLILMPVDEWSIDSIDFANSSDSIIGRDDATPKLLDIDSITNPKIDIQSLVRLAGSEQITSEYDTISPSSAILQENTQQRLWFLAAQTDQTGTLTAWIAPPEIAHSIQLFKNERYLTFSKGS